MSKVYSYVVTKGSLNYVRVAGGALVEYLGLDYKNASLEELQQTAAVAIQHLKDKGADCSKLFKKYKNLMIYRGGSHIKLVVDGELSGDLDLFYVLDVTASILPNSKDIYIDDKISI
ncbi:hypothetical protein B9T11_05105 [Wohlfahrtiimonas chitiniclastica]|uniref:hypothetical protein n=1 Tax=Wohlfahrtiimonas chitiniclastica TaxID=400946 RepID=UPI000B988837|nr:hypothetical protein [Wohlfahrtiimonas chitiniclastica]OYQ80862.1 hypothetical protein B9T11_05105 [Wohlfahrtiimonas chitiniclastica]